MTNSVLSAPEGKPITDPIDASLSTEKRRIILGVRSEIQDVQRVIHQRFLQMGQELVSMFQSEPSSIPRALIKPCQEIVGLNAQINEKETEIEVIRHDVSGPRSEEKPVSHTKSLILPPLPNEVEISSAIDTGPSSLSPSQGPVLEDTVPPIEVQNTPVLPNASVADPPMQTMCIQCGSPLRPGSKFCTKCGRRQ